MSKPSYHGRFIWQELHSNDPDAAVRFYADLLSWKAAPFAPGSPYTLFFGASGIPVAGATRLSDDAKAMGAPPHWLGYIGAEDVDAIAAQAVRLGGRIIQPAADSAGVGRTALLADPQGAVFGVYRPENPSAAGEGFSWFELAARERETALEFYRSLFGWELRPPMDMGGGMYYQTFGLGDADFGGAYTISAERPMPPTWLPYGHHASADAAAKHAVAKGAKVMHGPAPVPGGGRIVQFADPQGVIFAIHSPPAAMPAAKPAAKRASGKAPAKASAKAPGKASPKAVKKAAARKAATTKPAAKKAAARKPAARKAAARKPAARKPVKKPARKSVSKAARKPARKAARKVARKAVKKAVRRPAARKAARKK